MAFLETEHFERQGISRDEVMVTNSTFVWVPNNAEWQDHQL